MEQRLTLIELAELVRRGDYSSVLSRLIEFGPAFEFRAEPPAWESLLGGRESGEIESEPVEVAGIASQLTLGVSRGAPDAAGERLVWLDNIALRPLGGTDADAWMAGIRGALHREFDLVEGQAPGGEVFNAGLTARFLVLDEGPGGGPCVLVHATAPETRTVT